VVAAVPLLGVEGEHFAEQVEGLLLGALVHHGHGAGVGQIERLVPPRRSHHGGLALALARLTLALALAPQRCRWWLVVVLLGEEQLPQRSGGLGLDGRVGVKQREPRGHVAQRAHAVGVGEDALQDPVLVVRARSHKQRLPAHHQ
jgi:hypothetical protein